MWWQVVRGEGRESRGHLSKPPHVLGKDVGVRAFQLSDDLKALVELCEDVHHRAGKECML